MTFVLRTRCSSACIPRESHKARRLQCSFVQSSTKQNHGRRQPSQPESRRWTSNTSRSTPKTALFFPGKLSPARLQPRQSSHPLELVIDISTPIQAKVFNAWAWPTPGSAPFPVPANPSSPKPTPSSTCPSPPPSLRAQIPSSQRRAWPNPPSWRPRS